MSGTVKIGLSYKEYNPVTEGWPKNPHHFADEYIIEVRRGDGKGVTEVEARTAITTFLIDDSPTSKKKRKSQGKENQAAPASVTA